MRTHIYIDGFDFYYGAVKDTPYKWLNFKKLFEHLLDSKHKILSIKYYENADAARSEFKHLFCWIPFGEPLCKP